MDMRVGIHTGAVLAGVLGQRQCTDVRSEYEGHVEYSPTCHVTLFKNVKSNGMHEITMPCRLVMLFANTYTGVLCKFVIRFFACDFQQADRW